MTGWLCVETQIVHVEKKKKGDLKAYHNNRVKKPSCGTTNIAHDLFRQRES